MIIGQDPPKKVRKEIKRNSVRIVVDTTTVSERPVADSIVMEQRKVMKELKEQTEKVKR